MREHYQAVEKQTGITPEALAGAECPEELRYLWEYFGRLNIRRGASEGMPGPIANAEVLSWSRLNGVSLSTFEVEVLDGLEQVYLRHYRTKKAANT